MAKRKRRRSKVLTPEQLQKREQRKLTGSLNRVFSRAGFVPVATAGTEITFGNGATDIDQLFVCDGCFVLVEETCHKDAKKIQAHLNKKALFYQNVWGKERSFIKTLRTSFPAIDQVVSEGLDPQTFKVKLVYCMRHPFEKEDRPGLEQVIFMRHEYLKHFVHLTKTIEKSARFELYKFLGLELDDVQQDRPESIYKFDGFVLPESRSGLGEDFKVVSFYMDPKRLIELAYSLRRDSWMDKEGLYQRILSATKIRKMRAYLANDGHVYVNNIILGLPGDVRVTDAKDRDIPMESLKKVEVVKVHLPARFNSVGLIDGQHRVYSYHEGTDAHEKIIKGKRPMQQLLVTGLLFPKNLDADEKLKKEAKIFLEINAEQTSAKAELKQAIETIVRPFTSIALAKSVIAMLAKRGALGGELHDHYYDDGVIKTSSIIAYGLKYLVAIDDVNLPSSFISKWDRTKAQQLNKVADASLREEYVAYCASQVGMCWAGFYANVRDELKSAKNKDSRAHSVTMINGLLYCTRRLLQENRLPANVDSYKQAFASHGLDFQKGKFRYKSSQWKSLGDRLAKDCFGIEPLVESIP